MVSSDEVNTDDGELNGGQEKSPLVTAAIQDKLHRLVTPTSYWHSIRTNQMRTRGLHRRMMRKNAEGGPSVH